MKNLMYNHARKLVWIYVLLTCIKLFTANIYHVREEDPTIYFKFCPSIENKFIAWVEPGQLKDYYDKRYSWYADNQYWEIFHSPGGMQTIVDSVYDFVIILWWISSGSLIIFALYKMLKIKMRTQKRSSNE